MYFVRETTSNLNRRHIHYTTSYACTNTQTYFNIYTYTSVNIDQRPSTDTGTAKAESCGDTKGGSKKGILNTKSASLEKDDGFGMPRYTGLTLGK